MIMVRFGDIIILLTLVRSVFGTKFVIQLANEISLEAVFQHHRLEGPLEVFKIGTGFKAFSGDFDDAILQKLLNDPKVESISIDQRLQTQEYVFQQNAPAHLKKIASSSPTPRQPYLYHSNAGIGVDIYIFDTGIDSKNPNLQQINVMKLIDLTQDIAPAGVDANGHGTAMAGVVASETFGVLKKCNLIDMRIVEKDGTSKLSSLLRALDIAEKHVKTTERPSVFTIPLIMQERNAILNSAIENLNKELAIVVPAGNQNSDACNFSPASCSKNANLLVLGSLNQDDNLAEFTNFGGCVDLFTSGTDVITLSPTDLSQSSLIREVNGTSISCAIGSGVVGYYMSLGFSSLQAIEQTKTAAYNQTSMGIEYKVLQLKP